MPRRTTVCRIALLAATLLGLSAAFAGAATSCARPWRLIDTAKAQLPAPVSEWLASYKNIEVGAAFTHESYTYLLASWGLKDTATYRVEITGVDLGGSEVVVSTRWTKAAPFAAADPHYPHALARIRRSDKPVRFVAEGDLPGGWVPSLAGVPAAFRIHLPSQQTIYSHPKTDSVEFGAIFVGSGGIQPAPGHILVEGVARVFEGTVEYDFAGEDGGSSGHGFVTATSGGPDWGYFSISVPEPDPMPRYFRVYSTSAEDGRMQDLVMIDLAAPR